jgi:hypothetical protein
VVSERPHATAGPSRACIGHAQRLHKNEVIDVAKMANLGCVSLSNFPLSEPLTFKRRAPPVIGLSL